MHAPVGVCSLCRDLLVSDSPPSAWLLIAPRRQEPQRSGTDIADQNCEHAEGVHLKKKSLMTVSVRDNHRSEDGQSGTAKGGLRVEDQESVTAAPLQSLDVCWTAGLYLTCTGRKHVGVKSERKKKKPKRITLF